MGPLAVTLLLLLFASSAHASVIVVPDDHLTIGAAIVASSPGDSILVRQATYVENLVIPHDLSLIGMAGDPNRPTIRGSNNPDASTIEIQPQAEVRIVRLRVTGGRGDGGGGIRAPEGTELWLEDCDIYGNGRLCDDGGTGPGGVAAAVLHASHTRFYLNDGGTSAGAVVMDSGELVDCEIVHNYSGSIIQPPFDPECHGSVAGIEIRTGLIERCVFQNNTGNTSAASILAQESVVVRDCDFETHYINFNGYPGAVVRADGPMTIERSSFRGTQDESGGAAMVSSDDSLSMTDCEIVDNLNGVGLRGLIQLLDGPATFNRCLFARNGMGAIAALTTTDIWIESSTLVDGLGPGPVVSAFGGTLTLRSSIIAWNQSERLISCEGGVVATLDCNDWWNNPNSSGGCPPGPTDLVADPLFCNRAGGDYTLRSESPCVPPQSPPGCGLIGAFPIGCGVTDVEEIPPVVEQQLTVIPNPVRGMARFEVGTAPPLLKLNIFDSQGRLVQQLLGEDGRWQWIPGSSVPSGIYFARPDAGLLPGASSAVKFLYIR
jgi:hypothetical protein